MSPHDIGTCSDGADIVGKSLVQMEKLSYLSFGKLVVKSVDKVNFITYTIVDRVNQNSFN